jgi:hypothetical protein
LFVFISKNAMLKEKFPKPDPGEPPKLPRPPGSNEPEPDAPEPDDETRELVRPVKSQRGRVGTAVHKRPNLLASQGNAIGAPSLERALADF